MCYYIIMCLSQIKNCRHLLVSPMGNMHASQMLYTLHTVIVPIDMVDDQVVSAQCTSTVSIILK